MANVLDAVTGSATEKVVKPIVILVLVVVVIYFAKKTIDNYKTRKVGKSTGFNPSQTDEAINYDTLADAVHETFSGWFGGLSGSADESISERLMQLNNDELKRVNDRYNALYGQGTHTMYKAINSALICLNCPNYDALLKRLRALGLG